MSNDRKKRFARLAFGLNGALFLLASFSALQEDKPLLFAVQLIAGVVNLLVLAFSRKPGAVRRLNYLTFIMNFVVALVVAQDYRSGGTDYLHYVWYLVALFSIVALVVVLRKERKTAAQN